MNNYFIDGQLVLRYYYYYIYFLLSLLIKTLFLFSVSFFFYNNNTYKYVVSLLHVLFQLGSWRNERNRENIRSIRHNRSSPLLSFHDLHAIPRLPR